MSGKYLDKTGTSQVWEAAKGKFVAKQEGKGLSTNDYSDAEKSKLDGVAEGAQVNVIEKVSVNGSAAQITEKGINITIPTGTLAGLDEVGKEQLAQAVLDLINGKATAATTLSGYGITDAYTSEETDNKIKSAITGVYKVKGSILFAALPTADMAVGDVYNIKDDFVTTAAFVEGAGKECKAGTNVAYTDNGWDVMGGTYDFSDFMMKEDMVALTAEEIAAICTI